MSDTLPTIDEIFSKIQILNAQHIEDGISIDEAKAQLARIMAAERLDEITRAYGDGTKQHWSVIEYQNNRIAQLTRIAQAGGEDEG